MSGVGADEPLGSWQEAQQLLVYIGSPDEPSQFCHYLIGAFLDGDYGGTVVLDLEKHARSCRYCLLFLQQHYYKTSEQGDRG